MQADGVIRALTIELESRIRKWGCLHKSILFSLGELRQSGQTDSSVG